MTRVRGFCRYACLAIAVVYFGVVDHDSKLAWADAPAAPEEPREVIFSDTSLANDRNAFVRPRAFDMETNRLFVGRPERRDVLILSPEGSGQQLAINAKPTALAVGYVDDQKTLVVYCEGGLVALYDFDSLTLRRRFRTSGMANGLVVASSSPGQAGVFWDSNHDNKYRISHGAMWRVCDFESQTVTHPRGGFAAMSYDGRHMFILSSYRFINGSDQPWLHKLGVERMDWRDPEAMFNAIDQHAAAGVEVFFKGKIRNSKSKLEYERIVVDPAGHFVAVGPNIFDAESLNLIQRLETSVVAFVPGRPIAATIDSRMLRFHSLGNSNESTENNANSLLASRPIPPRWFPSYERLGNRLTVNCTDEFAVLHDGDRAQFLSLEEFQLPDVPLLRVRVSAPERLLVGKVVTFSVEPSQGVSVDLVSGPEGLTLENGVASWTPTLDQLGLQKLQLKLRQGDTETEQSFPLHVSHPTLPGTAYKGFVVPGPFGKRFAVADSMRGPEVALMTSDGKEFFRTACVIDHGTYTKLKGAIILGPDALWLFPGNNHPATRFPIAEDNTVGPPETVVTEAPPLYSNSSNNNIPGEALLLMAGAAVAYGDELLAPAVPGEPRRLADRFSATRIVGRTVPLNDWHSSKIFRPPMNGVLYERPPEGGLGKPVLLAGEPALWHLFPNRGKPPAEVGLPERVESFNFWDVHSFAVQPQFKGKDVHQKNLRVPGDGADLLVKRRPVIAQRAEPSVVRRIPVLRNGETITEPRDVLFARADSPVLPVGVRRRSVPDRDGKSAPRNAPGTDWFLVNMASQGMAQSHASGSDDASPHLVHQQSTFVLAASGTTTVRYEATGDVSQFRLVSNDLGVDGKTLLLESDDGTFEITPGKALSRQLGGALYQLYPQGGSPEPAVVSKRAQDYSEAVRPVYESLTGEPLQGIPVPFRVYVTAVGTSLETDMMFHDYVIDVPIKDVVQAARDRMRAGKKKSSR